MVGLCYLVSFVCQVTLSGPAQSRNLKAVEPSAGWDWGLPSHGTMGTSCPGRRGQLCSASPQATQLLLLSHPLSLGCGPKLSKKVASLFQPGGRTDRQRRGAKGTHISQPALHHMAAPRYQGGSCADLGPFFKVPVCPGKILLLCKKERTEIGGNWSLLQHPPLQSSHIHVLKEQRCPLYFTQDPLYRITHGPEDKTIRKFRVLVPWAFAGSDAML